MENESDFYNFPKVSIRSLFDEDFLENISITENSQICLLSKSSKLTYLKVGKKTAKKFNQENFDKNDIIRFGHIALITNTLSINNLRFYITDYQDLRDIFEVDEIIKKEYEKQRTLIKELLFK